MLKSKKLFIFDMDRTLIDSLGIWGEADKIFIYNMSGGLLDLKSVNSLRDEFLSKFQDENPYYSCVVYLKTLFGINGDIDAIIEYRKKDLF